MTQREAEFQEAAYQFSEAHYRLAMEAAGVGMWDWDLRRNLQHWSAQCRTIYGLLPEEQESYELVLARIHSDDREYVDTLVKGSLHTHTEYTAEYRVLWPDKSLHWVAARGRGMYDENGEAVRMIGVAFDVTARKETEEVRREADQRVRTVLESIQEACAHLDTRWCFTYVNSRAAHTGGYIPVDELLGRSIWDVYPQLLATPTRTYFHYVMETRQPVAYEIYYDEIQSWYDIRAYPTDDGGITVFLTDINERKALEHQRDHLLASEHRARIEAEAARQHSDELVEQLEQKNAFLHALMQQTPAGLIIATAPYGKVIFASEESVRVLGHPPPESRSYEDYIQYRAVHPDGTPYRADEYPLTRALLKGEVVRQEDMLYQVNGDKQAHLSVNAAPIRDSQGKIIAGMVTFNDVSERYELERKKDEFISMASHELRTPLTSIKGNLQLTQRRLRQLLADQNQPIETGVQSVLEHTMQWNERALSQVNVESRLINDLLDASRIQRQVLRVSLEPDNLVKIVREATNDMRVAASTRTIELHLPATAEIPVLADKVRLGQVICHYVVNALNYSPENQPVCVGLDLDGQHARVWVQDRGQGIAPEALEYIWDRFRQVGSFVDYTRQGGGLGLGLYINHALIQLHGGCSGVESDAGKGSTFWFTLPLLPQSHSK